MERFLMRDLEAWRENPCRKPLIINGARQVGKTWLIKEFGRRHYKSVAYVNMDNNSAMRELFDTGYDIDVLIAGLQLQTGVTIEPDSTLIVFDEVQENPKALTALKYFDEDPRGFSPPALCWEYFSKAGRAFLWGRWKHSTSIPFPSKSSLWLLRERGSWPHCRTRIRRSSRPSNHGRSLS